MILYPRTTFDPRGTLLPACGFMNSISRDAAVPVLNAGPDRVDFSPAAVIFGCAFSAFSPMTFGTVTASVPVGVDGLVPVVVVLGVVTGARTGLTGDGGGPNSPTAAFQTWICAAVTGSPWRMSPRAVAMSVPL